MIYYKYDVNLLQYMGVKKLMDVITLPWYKKLKHLRIEKGWSQYEAADHCGTNQKNYWNWENNKTYPTKIFRKSIASAFGVLVNEIFQESDKKAGIKND
ncbi:MAG: helix-turn-helix transcriptional regulator [Clostridiaceae bacterium]